MFLQEPLASTTASLKARKATGREVVKISRRKPAHHLKWCSPLPSPELVSSDSVPDGLAALRMARQVHCGAEKCLLTAVSGCQSPACPAAGSCETLSAIWCGIRDFLLITPADPGIAVHPVCRDETGFQVFAQSWKSSGKAGGKRVGRCEVETRHTADARALSTRFLSVGDTGQGLAIRL